MDPYTFRYRSPWTTLFLYMHSLSSGVDLSDNLTDFTSRFCRFSVTCSFKVQGYRFNLIRQCQKVLNQLKHNGGKDYLNFLTYQESMLCQRWQILEVTHTYITQELWFVYNVEPFISVIVLLICTTKWTFVWNCGSRVNLAWYTPLSMEYNFNFEGFELFNVDVMLFSYILSYPLHYRWVVNTRVSILKSKSHRVRGYTQFMDFKFEFDVLLQYCIYR